MTTQAAKRYVYFIKPIGMDGPIKIGCSDAPKKRLETLAVWSPFPLEIAATARGGFKLEGRLHVYFEAYHSHREWFSSSPELRGLIERVSNGIPIEDAIDLSVVKSVVRKRRGYTEDHRRCQSYRTRCLFAARRACGPFSRPPSEIMEIFDRWSGARYLQNDRRIPPTNSEIALLEEYIASPWPPMMEAAE